jgi:signal transduction histidine kinase
MNGFIDWLTQSEGLTPHGYCLIWDPGLIYLHMASDIVIAAAYFSIPAVLMIIARRRPDLNAYKCLHLFSAFIIACGITHILGVVTLWEPVYAISGTAKLLTALISLYVAILLWPLLPGVLSAPSSKELAEKNRALEKLTAELEERVEERTEALRSAFEEVVAAHVKTEEVSALKSQFMATMSHELRTPLNAIVGFSDMLKNGYAGDLTEQQAEYFGYIHSSAQLLDSLVTDVLEMQKLQIGLETPEEFDVREVVRESAGLVRVRAETADVEIHVDLPVHPVIAVTQRRALNLLLINLLTNAVKYGAAGGEVGVICRHDTQARQLHFTVWDRGPGIPKDKVESIFEPFVRLHDTVSGPSGTGIGLALVRQILDNLSGTVRVESEPGKGATFLVRLPDRQEMPEEAIEVA